MSLALALAINAIFAAALIAGLAHVMSRPKNLEPHRPGIEKEIESIERRVSHDDEQIAA